ncbi:hypothetical protein HDV00_001847 [Rhizophlyctis rosea]|nr:hypothetical protein HDV00_001847 [Rhizophlyctis rosea]
MMTNGLRLFPSTAQAPSKTVGASNAEYGVHDTLRDGIRTVRSEIIPGHPIENSVGKVGVVLSMEEANWEETQLQLRYEMHRRAFGVHAPIRLQMERTLLSQPKRIPVLPVSNLSQDILDGRDMTIDYEDFLGDPDLTTSYIDPHAAMEHSLGMGRL